MSIIFYIIFGILILIFLLAPFGKLGLLIAIPVELVIIHLAQKSLDKAKEYDNKSNKNKTDVISSIAQQPKKTVVAPKVSNEVLAETPVVIKNTQEEDIQEKPDNSISVAKKTFASDEEELASMYLDAGDYVHAYAAYIELADKGNTYAQYIIGEFCFSGENVERDFSNAVKYFQKSANKNDKSAAYLAICFCYGLGVDKSDSEAQKLLSRLLHDNNLALVYSLLKEYEEKGLFDSKHCYNLMAEIGDDNSMLELCKASNIDIQEKITRLKSAVELNNVSAALALANIYSTGVNVERDMVKAAFYYKKAGTLGSDTGFLNYAKMLLQGDNIKKDIESAINILEQMKNNVEAKYMLALIYDNDEYGKKNKRQSFINMVMAADLGSLEAKDYLNEHDYLCGNCKNHEEFRKSCMINARKSCYTTLYACDHFVFNSSLKNSEMTHVRKQSTKDILDANLNDNDAPFRCTLCKNPIYIGMKKCDKCGQTFDWSTYDIKSLMKNKSAEEMRRLYRGKEMKCPSCKELIYPYMEKCDKCGQKFDWSSYED